MSVFSIRGLRAGLPDRPILDGIDLEVASGEVHAVMGPNGSGKSTLAKVLMGHPGYVVTAGAVSIDGVDLLGLSTWQRAAAGLFLAPQYPEEIPGVAITDVVAEALVALGRPDAASPDVLGPRLIAEAAAIGLSSIFLDRSLNVDASGGEKKRIETLQLVALAPRFAILDELDSGLDVDAFRDVSRRIERATEADDGKEALGVLAITHYPRLLEVLRADQVHVLVHGKIVRSGGSELAAELLETGYAAYTASSVVDL